MHRRSPGFRGQALTPMTAPTTADKSTAPSNNSQKQKDCEEDRDTAGRIEREGPLVSATSIGRYRMRRKIGFSPGTPTICRVNATTAPSSFWKLRVSPSLSRTIHRLVPGYLHRWTTFPDPPSRER